MFPLVILACIFSPYIISLYGESFKSGWPTLVVILITAGLFVIQSPVGQVIAASGKMWTGFAMNLGWALAFIFGTLLLVDLGSLGLATSRAISYILHATWTFGFAFWIIRRAGKER